MALGWQEAIKRNSMILSGRIHRAWIVALFLAFEGLLPSMTAAQEWHELYSDGVAALRNGQAQEAVGLLARAVEERPEPGVLVTTYGTNFVPQYFPYLRLAEAYLLLDAVEDAAETLLDSARHSIEPADERQALEARVSAAIAARQPAPEADPEPGPAEEPTPSPTRPLAPEPAVGPAAPEPDRAPPPSTEIAPPAADAPASPVATPAVEPVQPSITTPDPALAEPQPREPAPVVDIVSDPPGSRVFLDDEPVGRTDPETGRLRLTTLTVGRHRVRLSFEGHEDVIREIEIADESVTVEVFLPGRQAVPLPRVPPQTSQPSGPIVRVVPITGLAVGLTFVIGLLIWGLTRRPAKSAVSGRQPSTVSDPGTDEVFPASFGDYSLLRRIGKGGMAAVYEATRNGETLALKRPLPGFLDDVRSRQRFLREAELGRTLHRPNIIRIFDHGQVGNTPYFTMELVRGETLAARLDCDGRLDLSEAARLTAQVAEALDYAHSKGVIHRDLKPSNIMIEPSGGVKVLDYGVARAQHLEELTTTRAFLGTPSYGAPETVQASSVHCRVR